MEQIHYIYKITFLKGTLDGYYYIGKKSSRIRKKKFEWSGYNSVEEWVKNEPMFDSYTGSGRIPKDYFKKYGTVINETFTKEVLLISPTFEENQINEERLVGDNYKLDPLCVNLIKGGLCESPKAGKDSYSYGKTVSEEMKQHLSQIMKERFSKIDVPWKGKQKTKEEKENISKALKNYYKTHVNKSIGKTHTEETKQHNSSKHKGLWKNPEYRNKTIESLLLYYQVHGSPNTGKHRSEETKGKLSAIFKGKPNYKNRGSNNGMYGKIPSNAKPILQISNDGIVIREWKSMGEAAKTLSLQVSNIYKVCTGQRGTCGGFKWNYK